MPLAFCLKPITFVPQQTEKRYIHIPVSDGLYWLKLGRTNDRHLVSKDGWRLLVWRAIREDQEGPDYASKVKVNSKNKRSHYPFLRMEFVKE